MTGTVATLNNIKAALKQDENQLALSLVAMYNTWKLQRDGWEEEKKELRNYIFATDTTSTTNSSLPWKNKTTIPKITQIRDNLHANYMDALFPNDDWLIWEGDDIDSVAVEKRKVLEQYTKNKALQSGLRETISQLLYDYIDYGNAFGEVIWVNETHIDPVTNEEVTTYMGPKALRISPFDMIFNPTATHFNKSVKFRRYIKSLGEVKKEMKVRTDLQFDEKVFKSLVDLRGYLSTFNREDLEKSSDELWVGVKGILS